jgi:dipeptidyl aminopeptidase/acylaminoacyl peptidase
MRLGRLVLVIALLVAATSSAAPTAVQSVPEVRISALRWSPDGRWLAFGAEDYSTPANNGLYLIRVSGSGGRRAALTIPYSFDVDLNWSPRGTQLAASDRRTTWLVTPRRGVVQFDGGFGDWSPDGKKILLVRRIQGVPTSIWVGDAKTGATNYLVDGIRPNWSPDGRRIAYSVYVRSNFTWCTETHLYSISPSGGAPLRLTNDPAPYVAQTATGWFPDSSRVIYAEASGGVECSPGTKAMTAPASGRRNTAVLGEGWPTWLPHSRRLALAQLGSVEILTLKGRRTAYFWADEFDESPGGRRIVFTRGPEVVVGNTSGAGARHTLATGQHPSWSSQNWIAFSAEGSCGRRVERIFVVRPNGKHRRALSHCPPR